MISDLLKNNDQLNEIITQIPSYIESNCRIKEFAAESFILRKDDVLEHVYLLLEGTVNILNEFEEGDRFYFAQQYSLNFLGEIEYLAKEKTNAATCIAETKCITLQIPLTVLDKWIKDDNNFFHFLTYTLAKKNYEASVNRGIERVYPTQHLLKLYLIKQLQSRIADNANILFHKSRPKISEELGISVRSVNRAILDLKNEKMITIVKGKIQISEIQYSKIKESIE